MKEALSSSSHILLHQAEGSWPMAFVVKNRVYGTIQEVQWQGRCGFIRLRLEQGKTESLTVPDIVILGVHGAHGDEIYQTLTVLLATFRLGTQIVFSHGFLEGVL